MNSCQYRNLKKIYYINLEWPYVLEYNQHSMNRYWRTRQSIIARMHTIGGLPKQLKGTISLRPEDNLLLISNHSVEFYGESSVKLTSRKMKKEYTAALFFSTNIFQIINQILYKFPGEHEEKTAEIHYSVAVDKSSSYLLREGLISNYPGINVIDILSLSEVIGKEINPYKNDIFGRLDVGQIRDSASKSEIEQRLGKFLRETLSNFGISLIGNVILRWPETSSEQLESFKSARRAEIEAKEELMQIEQESNLSNVQIEAQNIAQNKLKKSRRHLAKKEREFLQNQLETNHQMKIDRLDSEKETFEMKKNHELDVLRAKMDNELSEIELERIVNQRFADEEKQLALQQEKMNANFQQRVKEMELFFDQQKMQMELDKTRSENIDTNRILNDFEREEKLKSAKAEVEVERLENQTKMEQLKQLMEIKAMQSQLKQHRHEAQEKDADQSGSGQEISGNIISGNLNLNLSGKISAETNQKISDNVISGDVNVESKSEDD